jgi:hypothetical protein
VIDGTAMDADTKIDPVMLPSKSRIYIGVPNPILIISGIVSGPLQTWEMGSFILFSTVLSARDATSIYIYSVLIMREILGGTFRKDYLCRHVPLLPLLLLQS